LPHSENTIFRHDLSDHASTQRPGYALGHAQTRPRPLQDFHRHWIWQPQPVQNTIDLVEGSLEIDTLYVNNKRVNLSKPLHAQAGEKAVVRV
jgi:hypothetical protein